MFEFSAHNVNGPQWPGIPADNFERVLGAGGWRLDYLGATTYLARFGPETFEAMSKIMAEQQGGPPTRCSP
jgi:hypothetical protein